MELHLRQILHLCKAIWFFQVIGTKSVSIRHSRAMNLKNSCACAVLQRTAFTCPTDLYWASPDTPLWLFPLSCHILMHRHIRQMLEHPPKLRPWHPRLQPTLHNTAMGLPRFDNRIHIRPNTGMCPDKSWKCFSDCTRPKDFHHSSCITSLPLCSLHQVLHKPTQTAIAPHCPISHVFLSSPPLPNLCPGPPIK